MTRNCFAASLIALAVTVPCHAQTFGDGQGFGNPATAEPRAGDGSDARRRVQGTPAPEFPPGVFTDGGRYGLADFAGGVAVLIFYEDRCPTCLKSVPEINALAERFSGDPVYVMGVAAEDDARRAKQWAQQAGLRVPVFADNAGMLMRAHGYEISLQSIRRVSVIGPDGTLRRVGFRLDALENVIREELAKVERRFDPADFPPDFAPALAQAEQGRWDGLLPMLRTPLRSRDEAVRSAAQRLVAAARVDAQTLQAEAATLEATDPARAFETYERLAGRFSGLEGFEGAKVARDKMRELSRTPAVRAELAARAEYERLASALVAATPAQADEARAAFEDFASRYDGTPTAGRTRSWLTVAP